MVKRYFMDEISIYLNGFFYTFNYYYEPLDNMNE